MLLLALASARAEPFVLGGGLFDADSLQFGPDGSVHVLVSPKQTRMAAITNQITFTNDQGEVIGRVGGEPVRYVVVRRDGSAAVTPIPGPRGDWTEDEHVKDAALVLDGAGRPTILVAGEVCPSSGCVGQAWIARPNGDGGFETRELDRGPGIFDGLQAAREGDGWIAVSHVSGADQGFTGFVVYDDRGTVTPWIPAPKGSPEALLVDGGRRRLLYRAGTDLHVADDLGDTVVAEGARHHADAVVDGADVRYLLYDADRKRLRGGVAGGAGPVDLDAPESGWHHAVTLAGGAPLAAWYYYRNNYNKGVMVGRLGTDRIDGWTQYRSATANVGWDLDLAAGADGAVALVGIDRSHQDVILETWPSVEAMRAVAIPPAGDWTDRRRTAFFFAYGGSWFQWWNIRAAAPSEEDFSYSGVEPVTGTYGVTPGLGLEGGFAGKIGPVDLTLEYLRRSDGEASETISKLQNLVGKLGIEDLPLPDSEMQIHLRASDLQGAYTGTTGTTAAFTTAERLVELRYVGKQGYHFGLRYHGFRGPLDVFESSDRVVTGRFVADGKFTTGSFVAGWAVLDYLKKYEVRFFGPYFDAQAGAGFADVALSDPGLGRTASKAFGLTLTANGDLGLAAYQRVKKLRGAGGFVRAGVRGWGQYTGNQEPEETAGTTTTGTTGTAAPDTFRNFSRLDLRYGPYAHVGLVF